MTPSRWFAISIGCLVLALVSYAASPLVTLWSMSSALQHDDVDTIRASLDWSTVRSGLKADLGPEAPVSLASAQAAAPAEDELPAFGESFATTIVSHVIDDVVTPEHLVAMLSQAGAARPAARASAQPDAFDRVRALLARVQHLGFVGPGRFQAAVRLADDPDAPPVLVSLAVKKWQWKVTRIHVPDQLLTGGSRDRT